MEKMTEPAVVPAEPKIKPKRVPKRRQKPEEDSPWNVPKPKVHPTPKA